MTSVPQYLVHRAGGTGRGQGSNAPQNLAVPKGAYISWSPQKFWTFLRQCLAPHALQLGLQNEFAEWNLSIKGNYICREQQLLRPRKQYFCCELIRFIQAFRFDLMLSVLKHSKRAKKSQIFQKCAKCTLTLMSDYEIDF